MPRPPPAADGGLRGDGPYASRDERRDRATCCNVCTAAVAGCAVGMSSTAMAAGRRAADDTFAHAPTAMPPASAAAAAAAAEIAAFSAAAAAAIFSAAPSVSS